MPSLLDITGFCETLKEVTSIKMMDKKNFHRDGLFSEQIFGPLKNYTCQCGTYFGVSRSGGTCNMCEVDIVNSYERRRRFAKIVIPIKVMNPIFYDLISALGGSSLMESIDLLLKDEKSIMYQDGDDYVVVKEPESVKAGARTWERIEAVYEIVKGVATDLAEDIPAWKLVKDNLDMLLIKNIIVLPPDLRPAAKGAEKNNQIVDEINRYYMQILTKKEVMKNTIVEIEHSKQMYYQYFRQLQKDVNELYTHMITKLSKKEGLIRGNILGKRIDFSGRAVIIPDPKLNLDECILPYVMVLELFKLPLAKRLIEHSKFKLLNDAIDFIDNCIDLKKPDLFEDISEIVKGEVCILNRQPSLHRLSITGFKIKTSLDNVIKIHPLVCSGFNADFDGDQMAVYIPISEITKQETFDKLMVTKNLTSPSNESLATVPSQDIILGLFALTSNKITTLRRKITYKGIEITEGMKVFNDCLPDDYPVINDVIVKKNLMPILNYIKNNYSEDITMKVLDKIKEIGFKYATIFGPTISLNHCEIPNVEHLKSLIYESDDILTQINKLSSQEIEDELRKNFEYAYLIDSGARGTWDQAKQMILTRGYVSNFCGEICPIPIKNNLLDGLTEEEFFISTYGCRKGLLDVALNTGTSGYLSRKLIFTGVNLQLNETLIDCGTLDYLNVYVKDARKAKMLINKYYLNVDKLELITLQNSKSLIGKMLKVRSPVYCKSPEVCQVCYGDSHKSVNSKYIGILAAQSLGEILTQMTLRTFHLSGVANIKEGSENMEQSDVISDLKIVSNLFHKFKKNQTPEDLVSDLFDVYNNSKEILHIHIESIVSQLMWIGHYKWRLLKNRDKITPKFLSIQSAPANESWLLSIAFSNPKTSIIKGILNSGNYEGIFDRILLGEF
jgi:DNA-directed RNA polymerase subunit beta'